MPKKTYGSLDEALPDIATALEKAKDKSKRERKPMAIAFKIKKAKRA